MKYPFSTLLYHVASWIVEKGKCFVFKNSCNLTQNWQQCRGTVEIFNRNICRIWHVILLSLNSLCWCFAVCLFSVLIDMTVVFLLSGSIGHKGSLSSPLLSSFLFEACRHLWNGHFGLSKQGKPSFYLENQPCVFRWAMVLFSVRGYEDVYKNCATFTQIYLNLASPAKTYTISSLTGVCCSWWYIFMSLMTATCVS